MIRSWLTLHQQGRLHTILSFWLGSHEKFATEPLVILELLETSPSSVGKIGAKLGLDTSTTTPLLKREEQSGLIAKKRDVLDERRVLVELTAAGQASVWAVSDQIKSACQINERQCSWLSFIRL